MGKQAIALEDHVGRPLLGPERRDVAAIDLDASGAGLDEAADHAQQRGLAAARGAEDGEEIAAPDLEVERPHRIDRAIAPADAGKAHGQVGGGRWRRVSHEGRPAG